MTFTLATLTAADADRYNAFVIAATKRHSDTKPWFALQPMLLVLALATSGACGSRASRSDTVQATHQPSTRTQTPSSDVAEPAQANPAGRQAGEASATTNPTRTCDMQKVTHEEFFAANLSNPDGTVRVSGAVDAANAETRAQLAVHGSLSKEVIRRIIRRHIDEIRFCFERVLSEEQPAAQVTMRFIISPDGKVGNVALGLNESTSSELPCCIADAIHVWEFPKPEGGGVVLVTYPFIAN